MSHLSVLRRRPALARATSALGAAVLLAAGLVPALPAAAAPASMADGSGVVVPEGLTPVDGGDTAETAATVTSGRYVDKTAAVEQENIYKFRRTMDGSAVMFGVTVLDPEHTRRRERLRAVLLVRNPDGSLVVCGRAIYDKEQRARLMPLSSHAGFSNPKQECADADEFFLLVFSNEGSELPADVPYELDVWEGAPATNLEELPPTGYGSAEVYAPGPPELSVEPGTSMTDAPVLAPDDSVHVDLPLGRVSWFAVPLGFNEELDAVATVTDEAGSNGGAGVEIRLVSPVGGVVSVGELDTDRHQPTATLGSAPVTVETHGWLVSPRSRTDYKATDYFSSEAPLTAEPGLYYIAVYAGNVTGDEDATLPMTLGPGVKGPTGLYERGKKPVYAGTTTPLPEPTGAEPVAYDPSEPATAGKSGEPTAADRQDEGTNVAVVAGLAGGAALLVVAGVVLLVLNRRRQPTTR
ncbi:hypothetical protein ACT8ZV_15680 [Nocardioides sp. MAHUQ-72]|uniref:hypothetical protein n=1 Tax=unclassified Nocardioides TaxID=2615069 RepID=UPI0036065566